MSTPTVFAGEVYLGTEAGSLLAIHQTAPAPVHLAVYYDSALTGPPPSLQSRIARDHFGYAGYRVLNTEALGRFLADRVADGQPSAVVFATDRLPPSWPRVPGDTAVLRHYLAAGGKVVWVGRPIGFDVSDSLGTPIEMDPAGPERWIGVRFREVSFSENAAIPTPEGRRWGLASWFRGVFGIPPAAAGIPLAVDETGATTAWVRTFRSDRPGSGFVQLWGMGTTPARLEDIRRVAEYGLLRKAPRE